MCEHEIFSASVNVARLTDEAGKVQSFMTEIRINCVQCGVAMQFLGLESGCDTQGARCSVDGLEANIAVTPQGTVPSPLQRMAYGIKAFT